MLRSTFKGIIANHTQETVSPVCLKIKHLHLYLYSFIHPWLTDSGFVLQIHSGLWTGWLGLFLLVHFCILGFTLRCQNVLFPPPTPLVFEVGINLLQDVNGVIDEQGQPGQPEKDPGSHEDAVPLWVYFVWVTVCKEMQSTCLRCVLIIAKMAWTWKWSGLYLPQNLQNQLCSA